MGLSVFGPSLSDKEKMQAAFLIAQRIEKPRCAIIIWEISLLSGVSHYVYVSK
jgi:hypothetical protein